MALQAAAGGGHLDVIQKLLNIKININITTAKYGGCMAL